MWHGSVCILQKEELAALKVKRDQEEKTKRAQAKRDKLFVASPLTYLLVVFAYWPTVLCKVEPLSRHVVCRHLWRFVLWLVWQTERRCLHLPRGFQGWPIQWDPCWASCDEMLQFNASTLIWLLLQQYCMSCTVAVNNFSLTPRYAVNRREVWISCYSSCLVSLYTVYLLDPNGSFFLSTTNVVLVVVLVVIRFSIP